MDTQQHQNNAKEEKAVDKPVEGKQGKGDPQAKQQRGQLLTSPTTSPPSASSSPTHEFSCTISVHSSSTQQLYDKTIPHPSSFAIDLSPADEIFFHGHLLPLHLLSHLPVSPRSSTNSLDSFTLPIKELLEDQTPIKGEEIFSTSNGSSNRNSRSIESESFGNHHQRNYSSEPNGRSKPKSFSIFGWRKGCEVRGKEKEYKEKHKRRLSFDVSNVLKRYVRMVRPLLFFKGRRENVHFHRQAYSFSDSSSWRNRQELRGRRGEFSAPASMRTSPNNSGLLLPLPSSTSDSTMEELQAAIQAAIAHCKNSIAAEEKIKFQP